MPLFKWYDLEPKIRTNINFESSETNSQNEDQPQVNPDLQPEISESNIANQFFAPRGLL